jgi:transcriptional regulator with XRE-family HTH domain
VDNFGTRLREAIDTAGLTQLQVAQRIGVHPNLVSSWVGDKTLPCVPNLAQLVSTLQVDADWLLLGGAKRDRDDPVVTKVRRLGGDLIELVEMARDPGRGLG